MILDGNTDVHKLMKSTERSYLQGQIHVSFFLIISISLKFYLKKDNIIVWNL